MPAHNAPEPKTFDGSGLRIAIVHARWNTDIIDALVEGAKSSLLACGVKHENICIEDVPGSFELPKAVKTISNARVCTAYSTSPAFNAVIAIGCLIKGETMHFEYIADAVSHGLMNSQLESSVPVIFGLLTCLNEGQARARAGLGTTSNAGEEWGRAAVEMAVKERRWATGEFTVLEGRKQDRTAVREC